MKENQNSTVKEYDIAIIGAGFAGLGTAIRLKKQGTTNFIIFERANEIGGTWRDNTYPGCACDIPSLLYSYSFEPNPNWTRSFSKQGEIFEYMKGCMDKWNLRDQIQFNTEIASAAFDKNKGRWHIADKVGNSYTTRLLISAAGPFNEALIPNIKGRDRFQGESFHSLHWKHDYDLKGKRVAVVGTGASAIQFVPEIAPVVDKLYVFQRTAPYIAPKPDKEFTEVAHKRFKRFPWYQRFWREFIYWFLEWQGTAQYSDNARRAARKKLSLDHLDTQIKDPELKKKLTPDYAFGCKRVLISENYYPALARENVELISEGAGEIKPNSICAKSGQEFEVDTIIYGTGFYTTEFPNIYKVYGKEGRNVFEKFNEEGPEAYLGMAVTDYPNFLFMVGPNSGLGHNSIIHMMESQLNYILDYWKKLSKTSNPNTYFDIKPNVQAAFNKDIQEKLSKMVWSSGGCKSYYLKNNDGKNTSIWPGSTMTYRSKTKKMILKEYDITTPVNLA